MRIDPELARNHRTLLRHVALSDFELLRRLQAGETAPPELDIDALCERVEMWTRHQLLVWVASGNPWWVPDLLLLVASAWRRKHTQAIVQGDYFAMLVVATGAAWAFAAVLILWVRCLLRCASARALRPVLRYTAA